MKKALVFLNGDSVGDYEKYNKYIVENYDVFCADGGAKNAEKAGIVPKILFGDMDSIPSELLEKYKSLNIEIRKYPVEKDMTDTEIVIESLIGNDYKEIILTGAIGGRSDHLLGNIFLLEKYCTEKCLVKMVNGSEDIELLEKCKHIENKDTKIFSIVPLTDKIEGLTINGAKYNVENVTLYRGDSRGISNETVGEETFIEIKTGKALIVINQK